MHDPEPPAAELWCARRTCTHLYPQHPGGGACLWWDPRTGDHCDCPGFLYTPPIPPGDAPPRYPPSTPPGSVCHYLPGQPPG